MSDPWRFIPVSEYASPSEPAAEAVRTGLRAVWNNLRTLSARRQPDKVEPVAPSLRSAPKSFLDRLVPEPEWGAVGLAALDTALKDWREASDDEAGCRVVVAAPHSGVRAIATAWAEAHELPILAPPSYGQILDDVDGWLGGLAAQVDQRLFLPQLEKCYLRHQDGVALVRGLLDTVRRHSPPWVFVCDSWAWAYLARVTDADALLARPLTLAPLSAAELTAWLRELSSHRLLNPVTVRQTSSDRPLLQVAGSSDQPSAPEGTPPEFILQLAAYSRGNPGVAWSVWRHCLHIGEEDHLQGKAEDSEAAQREEANPDAPPNDVGYTVWVHPWEKSVVPAMPNGSGLDEAFVLHVLLLHGDLGDEWLRRLLPLEAGAIAAALARLYAAGLVGPTDDAWQVTPAGYPAVRAFLRDQALLVDAL